MINDIIGDSLARMRNAIMRNQVEVELAKSKMVESICGILKDNKYIDDYSVAEGNILVKFNTIETEHKRKIKNLKRVSKPGLRIYRGYKEIKPVLNGYGISILTTPKGVMSSRDARKQKTGGEVICEVY
jgi:small subunit ribosomal protein S8